ncbi:MAG: hypothetical protein MUF38_11945 [Anaerolineae bacterium]|nr:hypothetical protein [Anaerolineae bacterium]
MRTYLAIFLLLLLAVSGTGVSAQTTLVLGEPATATVTVPDIAGLVPFTFTLDELQYVSIVVRTQDETDPAFRLSDAFGRNLIVINDNPNSSLVRDPKDAAYDDTLLLPGTYLLEVGRVDAELVGSGELEVLVQAGEGDALGIGATSTLDLSMAANEGIVIPLMLERGDIVSIAAVALNPDLDLRLILRTSDGQEVTRNEDNETQDLFVSLADPRIYQFSVPESETYLLTVRPFGTTASGDFILFTQRHGRLAGEATREFLTGAALDRQRTTLNVDFEAGESVRLTARAVDAGLDPELTLLDPNSVIIGYNDDHVSGGEDLEFLDSRIDRVFIEETGTYEINVTSVSGAGQYEVEVERLGRFEPLDEPLVLDAAQMTRVPLSAPETSPEATPEVTAEPGS